MPAALETIEPPIFATRSRAEPRTPALVKAGATPLHQLDGDLTVEVVRNAGELASRSDEWDDLAQNAAEPNIFIERWFLQPALEAFGPGKNLRIILVTRHSRRKDVAPGLVGLFAFQRRQGRVLRERTLTPFTHDYGFLNSPLIRKGHESATWSALLNWAQTNQEVDLLDLPLLRGGGPVHQGLIDVVHQQSLLSLVVESHVRALLRPATCAETYINETLTSKHRHENERQMRRLSELGRVTFRPLQPSDDVDAWIDQFLDLEAAGWKGEARTALSHAASGRDFFRTVLHAARNDSRLQALSLCLDGRPLAMKVNFQAGPGAFAFKIAYDEQFSKQSPGVQLELENIRQFHERPELTWMDSCAAADHPMINRLWRDRTVLHHVQVSTGTVRGNLAIGLRPLNRAARRILFKKQQPQAGSPKSRTAH